MVAIPQPVSFPVVGCRRHTFYLPMADGFIQRYHGVQNVIVRLSTTKEKHPTSQTSAILVNCHFDSVPQVRTIDYSIRYIHFYFLFSSNGTNFRIFLLQ